MVQYIAILSKMYWFKWVIVWHKSILFVSVSNGLNHTNLIYGTELLKKVTNRSSRI